MNHTNLQYLLSVLNEEQRKAVVHGDGPVLVLAGAGSGKTRVLIHRIAYLIARGRATPDSIMAVTFTNKAATEMRDRLEKLGGMPLNNCWISTFHSLGARILRREAALLGLESSFNIYDQDDALNCIKLLMEENSAAVKEFPPKAVAYTISNAKNAFIDPQRLDMMANNDLEKYAAIIYQKYEKMLRENNALDFDDLLRLPVILFENHPPVLDYYQQKFEYILVDEYQDTNRSQYYL
ncbi:MAG: ATP-dependent DNA helicase PcrA, partial [Calditrichaeota bacterium]